jgi:hypothetical protein
MFSNIEPYVALVISKIITYISCNVSIESDVFLATLRNQQGGSTLVCYYIKSIFRENLLGPNRSFKKVNNLFNFFVFTRKSVQ